MTKCDKKYAYTYLYIYICVCVSLSLHRHLNICRVVYLQVCKRGYGPIPAQVRYGSVASVGSVAGPVRGPWGESGGSVRIHGVRGSVWLWLALGERNLLHHLR